MSQRYVIAGTGTDVGKTILAAGLCRLIGASYWKPVQAGIEGQTDSEIVARLAELPPSRILPEFYRLKTAASPHLAAERDQVTIDAAKLAPPQASEPLVIELAGGLMVPITRELLQIDMIKAWNAPVILTASSTLGTLNHTLLSLEALRARGIPIHGVALVGPDHPDNQRTITEIGRVKILGQLPHLDPLNAETLQQAITTHFQREDFL